MRQEFSVCPCSVLQQRQWLIYFRPAAKEELASELSFVDANQFSQILSGRGKELKSIVQSHQKTLFMNIVKEIDDLHVSVLNVLHWK